MDCLKPDGVLFVGDLSEGDIRFAKAIKGLPLPTAVILGNHDRGRDVTGYLLQSQLNILGEIHCGWRFRGWSKPPVSVVGARPCSAGGGFYLSRAVQAVFGPITIDQSVDRIVNAVNQAPEGQPLVILAHSGPQGLGSEHDSPCGRDWKSPALDWGDQDLSIALDQIRKSRIPELVVFGHTHHHLKKGKGIRRTFVQDRFGTVYLNAACVPRKVYDSSGIPLCHLSWVEFLQTNLQFVSHRWFRPDGTIAYEEILLDKRDNKD